MDCLPYLRFGGYRLPWPTGRPIITRLTQGSPAIKLTVANLLCYLRLAAIPVLLALAALDLHKAFLMAARGGLGHRRDRRPAGPRAEAGIRPWCAARQPGR